MTAALIRWGLWPARREDKNRLCLDGYRLGILALHLEKASAGTRRPWVWRGWDG